MKDYPVKIAVIGAGFWAGLQVRAWIELVEQGKAELVAICNRTREKAESFKERFGFAEVYDDVETLLGSKSFDVVDIITSTPSHYAFVMSAIDHRVPVIVQKPMASTLKEARSMAASAAQSGVPLIVHENYRWWPQIRQVKELINSGRFGALKDVTIQWRSGGMDYYEAQPYFRDQERFLIGEVGVHLVDVARFIAGSDVNAVYAQDQRFNGDIRGEDFARMLLTMNHGTTANIELGVETLLEHERPPQVFITAFCTKGTIELGPDFRIAVTTKETGGRETRIRHISMPEYSWAGAYGVGVACMVSANTHYANCIRKKKEAETSGEDNVNTLAATLAAYLSVVRQGAIDISDLDTLEALLDEAHIGYPAFPLHESAE